MKLSLSWLKQLVDYNLSPQELADKLSLTSIGVKEQTDSLLELDLTYNRGDLLSMRGVAREIAAITGRKPLFSDINPSDYYWEGKGLPESSTEVKDSQLCPVYCIAKIEGLTVKPSSEEWVKKLQDCGVRTVNSVADITNLIMLEYGQPMHSFDASEVKDGALIVRVADPGEKMITLDGKERNLDTTDLLIADSEKALGLAGVMGGKNSEITDKTNTILLEAAIFDPAGNRQTSKRHGLYSEATKRFQHGLTRTNLLQALSAAIKMYEELGGKLTAISLIGNMTDEPKTVNLRKEKVGSLLGLEIGPDFIKESLEKLQFKVGEADGDSLNITAPYWRLDIGIEEDLIEEIARIYGYEKIDGKPLDGKESIKIDQTFYDSIYNLRNQIKDLGVTEVQTYSFYSSAVLENLSLKKDSLLKIANPISSETEYLRNNLWPNLLEAAAKNIKNGIKDIAIFEIGKTYSPMTGELPKENYHLAIALCNGTDNPIAELSVILRRLAEGSLARLAEPAKRANASISGTNPEILRSAQNDNNILFHPTRFSALEKDGKSVGWIAEVHPRFVNQFKTEQRVAVLEIEITKLISSSQ